MYSDNILIPCDEGCPIGTTYLTKPMIQKSVGNGIKFVSIQGQIFFQNETHTLYNTSPEAGQEHDNYDDTQTALCQKPFTKLYLARRKHENVERVA